MNYKVLITTSGLGSRLGDFTRYTNKSLIRIKDKPIISYIIDQYPKSTEFIVTLGYFGDQVKQFLKIAYPDRKFNFVEVDKFEGPGSSLLYSMLKAKKLLNSPFIFHAADTLVTEKIPLPKENWVGGHNGEDSSQYASFDTVAGRVERMYEKGMIGPDYLHIGLVGINDHEYFWRTAEKIYKTRPNKQSLSDVHVITQLVKKGLDIQVIEFKDWLDTGNVTGLLKAIRRYEDVSRGLDKVGEATFFLSGKVIKFFYNEKILSERISRTKFLKKFIPDIEEKSKNFMAYKFIEGETLSSILGPSELRKLLDWLEKDFWKKKQTIGNSKFKDICRDFYKNKTEERIASFFKQHALDDKEEIINELITPSIKEILKKIDFDYLANGLQSTFHGDLVLENIIKSKKNKYVLLDWRQNFGGELEVGDRYYDLAKLNHNMVVNHDIVDKNLLKIEIGRDKINYDIMRKETLVESQNFYLKFLEELGYDVRKVKLLTSLIWLNMAPLHQHPFNLFLFYFGKYNLWKTLNEK